MDTLFGYGGTTCYMYLLHVTFHNPTVKLKVILRISDSDPSTQFSNGIIRHQPHLENTHRYHKQFVIEPMNPYAIAASARCTSSEKRPIIGKLSMLRLLLEPLFPIIRGSMLSEFAP